MLRKLAGLAMMLVVVTLVGCAQEHKEHLLHGKVVSIKQVINSDCEVNNISIVLEGDVGIELKHNEMIPVYQPGTEIVVKYKADRLVYIKTKQEYLASKYEGTEDKPQVYEVTTFTPAIVQGQADKSKPDSKNIEEGIKRLEEKGGPEKKKTPDDTPELDAPKD